MIKNINFLFVTFFGIGTIRYAPGTITSLITTILLFSSFHILNLSKTAILIILIAIFLYSFLAVENYIKEITLKELSEISCMTPNSFCRYFKDRTGKTAFQFIREYRISRACQMIINTRKPLSQIYLDSGFNSLSSFNRVFKSIKGISSSEYKSKYQRLKNNSSGTEIY